MMFDTAREFVRLWKLEKETEAKRKTLAETLMPVVKAQKAIEVDGEKIVLDSSSKRCPTKQQLVAAFGEAGAKFWDALAPSTYTYLTVVPAKTKASA